MDRKVIGFIMLGGGGLLGLIAVLLIWNGWSYWRMTANLERSVERWFQGDAQAGRATAATAADWSAHPAALVASADLGQADSQKTLQQAASLARGNRRRAVATAQALGEHLQGKPADLGQVDDADRALLEQMGQLRDVRGNSLPELPLGSDAPNQAVLRRCLEERLQAAWRIGDGRALRADTGRLLTIDPRHPARPLCILIGTWFRPHDKKDHLVQPLGRIGDDKTKATYVRKLLELTGRDRSLYGTSPDQEDSEHERRRIIAAQLIRPALRTEDEQQLLDSSSKRASTSALNKAVDHANTTKTPAAVANAVRLAFQAKEYAVVDKLLPLVPAENRQQVELALAEARWDLAKLKAAGGDAKAYLPTVRFITKTDTRLNFHLVTGLGVLPPKAVRVSIDGNLVPAKQIKRHGGAFSVTIPGGLIGVEVTIEMDGQPLYAGRVVQK